MKLARVNMKLTQAELGSKAGIDEETASSRVSQYEREISEPSFAIVRQFALVLDVPGAYFYAEDDDLASLILQYHRFKKERPESFVMLIPR
nr:helix-turn-helix transcriptional regulator [Winslowiella toletana]